MNTITNIIGKQVISSTHAKYIGTIINAYTTHKIAKITHLEILDIEEEKKMIFPISQFRNLSSDVVIFRGDEKAESTDIVYLPYPINLKCYTSDGHYFGKIRDIVFDEKHRTESIIVDELLIKPNRIKCYSKELVILLMNSISKDKPKINTFEIRNFEYDTQFEIDFDYPDCIIKSSYDDKSPNHTSNANTTSLPNDTIEIAACSELDVDSIELHLQEDDLPRVISPTSSEIIINKLAAGYEFLTGRKLLKSIYDYDNSTILAIKDSVIDRSLICSMARRGKLVELVRFSAH